MLILPQEEGPLPHQGMCWDRSVIQALLHAGREVAMVYSPMGLLDIPDFWGNVDLLLE